MPGIFFIISAKQEVSMQDLLLVGVISSTHGIAGEVKVFPTTDDVNRFDYLKEVILDTGREKLDLTVAGVKYFKNMVILKFKGIDNINEVEKYRGCSLWVTRENAVELEEDEYFVCDMIGLKVMTDEGEELGELTDVIQTGANDVYAVKTKEGKEILLPAIADCVRNVNIEENTMTVHVMDGLLDL